MCVKSVALLYSAEEDRPTPASPNYDDVLSGSACATHAMKSANVFLAADPLDPVATAKSVRIRKNQRLVTDGPFAETKERLGGYYVLDCAHLDQAVEMASPIPAARYGTIELRPVQNVRLPATT